MGKLIEKLTKRQENQIPLYIDKWVNMATKPIDKDIAQDSIYKIYKRMGYKNPIIIYGPSPLSTCIMCAMYSQLYSQLDSQLYSQLRSQLYSQLRSQLYSQLDSQLDSQLHSQLDSQLRSQLYSQLHSQLRSQLYSQLGSQLDSQLGSQLGSQLRSQLYSQLDSQLDSQLHSQLDSQLRSQLGSQLKNINNDWYFSVWWLVWCAWYEYGKYIGVSYEKKIYDLFINFNTHINFIIPYDGICFVSEKPEYIKWSDGLLHNDGGPAVYYADGYSLYSLNGVRVPKELVETPANKIDSKILLKERNAEIRREIVRKIGIERICKDLKAKCVDKKNGYELLLLDLGDRKRPYLKMKNPSIKTYHIEGVHPDCKSIADALRFRNGTEEQPIILT